VSSDADPAAAAEGVSATPFDSTPAKRSLAEPFLEFVALGVRPLSSAGFEFLPVALSSATRGSSVSGRGVNATAPFPLVLADGVVDVATADGVASVYFADDDGPLPEALGVLAAAGIVRFFSAGACGACFGSSVNDPMRIFASSLSLIPR
jgi:hypothetical protein